MKRLISKQVMLIAAFMLLASAAGAEIIVYDRDIDYGEYIKHDRFLSAEIWTDNDEYYEGDNIVISFQADKDCFVAVYNIDTRGNVNLIYPTDPRDNGWIEGGQTYQIPSQYDDYDLTVRGPEGVEYLQIVASRQPFRIPDWFNGSDLVADNDPYDFMDFVNANYFQSDRNMKRAFDMTSFMVKEWNDYYFRPVHVYHSDHRPYWDWDWGYYGSVYIDYPWGATIYIDGVYWGIAPLFMPRVYYGWHWITVYDPHGYCWEDRISVVRRKSIVLDRTMITTRPEIKSRFKEVQTKGYLNPAKNGYPEYDKQITVKKTRTPVTAKSVAGEKYKVAEERQVTSRYTKTAKTNTGAISKDRSTKGAASSDRYKTTTKSTSDGKATYGTDKKTSGGKSDKSFESGKSSSDSNTSKTYKSRKSSSGKASKSGSTSKPSSSEKSAKGSKSGSVDKSDGGSSSKSSSSEKSSSKTTSSGTTTTKKGR
ncbi:MAG: hypothetical protein CVT49_11235 [candidate division Zixibacteria bacterium HGW-Zixibacteria-1]|nr:MAG: hypothetical protein CVT49_11235 [candidate division Zixibacteria bacterium HGW-Zixibacteria-1]